MANEFEEMAANAKAEHEARVRQRQEHHAVEREAKQVEQGVAALRTQVMPLLEEAKEAFRKNGIEAAIETDFDVKNFVSRQPSVQFMSFGPPRASDGYRFETPAAVFSSNGEDITIKYPKELGEQERAPVTEHDQAVVRRHVLDAAKEVLDSYYRHLRG